MKGRNYKVVGLMSGSSLDGLDIAYCSFQMEENKIVHWQLLQAETSPFSNIWMNRLRALPQKSGLECMEAHAAFGRYMGELVNVFLRKHQIKPDLIASHGHTIFHYPSRQFTFQLGDGAALSAVTGCDVAADFRTMDVALGGEGAPLAPVADYLLFKGYDFYLNIGGIANISFPEDKAIRAFDIGPANQVLNALSHKLGQPFDNDGLLGRKGNCLPSLLQQVDQLPFFEGPFQKSVSNHWVREKVIPVYMSARGSCEDKLHTACLQLAGQLARALSFLVPNPLSERTYTLLATGGGALNKFLIECIENACSRWGNIKIIVPESSVVLFKEAVLMALMGVLRTEALPNAMATVTGAGRDSVGGALFRALPQNALS